LFARSRGAGYNTDGRAPFLRGDKPVADGTRTVFCGSARSHRNIIREGRNIEEVRIRALLDFFSHVFKLITIRESTLAREIYFFV
jgi:hypothetical protein